MVQLSVLLCLIPLSLENAMMQAHVTQVGWEGGVLGGAGRGGVPTQTHAWLCMVRDFHLVRVCMRWAVVPLCAVACLAHYQ